MQKWHTHQTTFILIQSKTAIMRLRLQNDNRSLFSPSGIELRSLGTKTQCATHVFANGQFLYPFYVIKKEWPKLWQMWMNMFTILTFNIQHGCQCSQLALTSFTWRIGDIYVWRNKSIKSSDETISKMFVKIKPYKVFGYNLNVMKNHLVYNVWKCPWYLSVNTIRLFIHIRLVTRLMQNI